MKAESLQELSTDDLRDYLEGWHLDALANQTIKEHLSLSLEKFQRTLEFLPSETGRVLQIGASPFFLSSLLKRFSNFDLELVDFVIRSDHEVNSEFSQRIIDGDRTEFNLNFLAFDIEVDPFPYDDSAFDGVIMCDVLQTLSRDPVAVLAEIYRVLKPGGWLLISTPNAAYYENLLKIWLSRNPSSPYSSQTSISRDNRRYTIPELIELFSELNGLVINQLQGYSISSDRSSDWRLPTIRIITQLIHIMSQLVRIMTRLAKRNNLNEEYIFCLAQKEGTFFPFRPSWLYKAYAPSYPQVVKPLERSVLVLPTIPPRPSRFPRRVCKLCDELDWKGSEWLGLLDEMGEPYKPGIIHRKAWEWAQGIYALKRLDLVREDATALGVGAGTEQVLFYLANHIGMVTATDIYGQGSFAGKTAYDDMLITPEKYAKIPFRKDHLTTMYMDGTNLEFPDNHFDFAFSFSSIEHFGSYENAARSVREMERVVKPGGAVIITTEVVLNGIPHRDFFRPLELQQYLIEDNSLQLIEDIDYTLSDQTLAHPVDFGHPGFNAVIPHVICHHSGVYWTSVCLVLLKSADY